ncbi:MAG TPA: MotA/TolQ/ExbB proton channel family protein [Gammaproteobacteria bacterium]|nr:MotA/TolQ/ExbB proton channel family protein [Gammaproteobacteria bacterium]
MSYLAEQGGPIVLGIFALGVLLWALIAERIWYFWRVLPRQVANVRAQWEARSDHSSWCARQIRAAMISQVNVSMTSGFPLLAVMVPMAPLMGLVGTVTGMLQVFSSMELLGTADARSMAAGVSAAMICTICGLVVAVSGLYPVYYFRTRAIRETERLADELSL